MNKSTSFLIRIDDVHEAMNWKNMIKITNIYRRYKLNSILGVIPYCQDEELKYNDCKNEKYYEFLRESISKGDSIAQHGYRHIYDTQDSGILNINKKSEFAGHSYKEQYRRINEGKMILLDQNLWQGIFMPPGHSYDEVTLDVLNDLDFKVITDGYGFYPTYKKEILHIPQLFSNFYNFLPGIQQNCIHPNTFSELQLIKFENFIKNNQSKFLNYNKVMNQENKYISSLNISWQTTSFLIQTLRKTRRFLINK